VASVEKEFLAAKDAQRYRDYPPCRAVAFGSVGKRILFTLRHAKNLHSFITEWARMKKH
jgi:hypothetical protein